MVGACALGTGVLGAGVLGAGALVTRGAEGGVAFWIGRLASGAVGCDAGCDTSPTDVTTGACSHDDPGHAAPCDGCEPVAGDDPGHGCACGFAGATCACGAGLLLELLCGR